MKRIAIFPGSFDPFTNGHKDIVIRGLNFFDEIIIALGYNTAKIRYFELEYMVEKISSVFQNRPQVKVEAFSTLTAEFAHRNGAKFLLRGLRNTTDFEYENSIAQVNRYIYNELETMFLITSHEYAAIRSSIIREVHKYGGDVSAFLPYSL